MYYIAHKFGFVSDIWYSNGVKKLRFEKDIREAKVFESVEDANDALQNATYGRHFCILSTQIEYKQKVDHAAKIEAIFGDIDAIDVALDIPQ